MNQEEYCNRCKNKLTKPSLYEGICNTCIDLMSIDEKVELILQYETKQELIEFIIDVITNDLKLHIIEMHEGDLKRLGKMINSNYGGE